MINKNNLAFRYFSFFETNQNKNWLDLLNEIFESKSLGLPETLTLLHPKWYETLHINTTFRDPRGDRNFKTANSNSNCLSRVYWGYDCPFLNSKVQVDHIFPYSRGGLTHFSNATYLCEQHNALKNSDIHILPWDSLIEKNTWIQIGFENIFRSSPILSGVKMYIPLIQLSRL